MYILTFSSAISAPDRVYSGKLDFDKPNGHKRLVVKLVGRAKRVLEVGPAAGQMSAEFSAGGCRVWGVEIDPALAAAAAQHCEKVLVGDIENGAIFHGLSGQFDRVVCCDVLEHLTDPERVLAQLKDLLTDDAALIISVPNVTYLSSRLKILLGIFNYQSSGIMDQNHLRFFTVKTLKKLVERAGYTLTGFHPLPLSPRGRRLTKLPGGKRLIPFLIWSLPAALARAWPGLFAYHLVIEAVSARGELVYEARE